MQNNLFIDVACSQLNCAAERICGDSFLFRRIAGGRRTIVVLSDGMGHGVKANILSTLTSTMLLNFISSHQNIEHIAEMILKTLPVCSTRKISYSTFTMMDIDNITGDVTVVEHDNPSTLIMRGATPLTLEWERGETTRESGPALVVRTARFRAQADDRFVIVSDGVTQSGQRENRYKFGWGEGSLSQFVGYTLSFNRHVSSRDLALQVLSKASQNDSAIPADDMSCVAIHVRAARRLLLVSCPPSNKEDNVQLVKYITDFDGEKVVCGYPVAEIIATEMNLSVEKESYSSDPQLPPMWKINGFNLVTEGIVTLNRVLDNLEHVQSAEMLSGTTDGGRRPVSERLCRMLLSSDEITFVVGTKRNIDATMYLPDELELRRNILRRIASLLESKFSRQVTVRYL